MGRRRGRRRPRRREAECRRRGGHHSTRPAASSMPATAVCSTERPGRSRSARAAGELVKAPARRTSSRTPARRSSRWQAPQGRGGDRNRSRWRSAPAGSAGAGRASSRRPSQRRDRPGAMTGRAGSAVAGEGQERGRSGGFDEGPAGDGPHPLGASLQSIAHSLAPAGRRTLSAGEQSLPDPRGPRAWLPSAKR